MKCKRCYSQAINPHLHDRIEGRHPELCDVCYWRAEHERLLDMRQLARDISQREYVFLNLTAEERERRISRLIRELDAADIG